MINLVALGGWLVIFMMRVRGGDPFSSGMTAVGFWLGLTMGRVVLGFVTGKVGEKRAVVVCPTGSPPSFFKYMNDSFPPFG